MFFRGIFNLKLYIAFSYQMTRFAAKLQVEVFHFARISIEMNEARTQAYKPSLLWTLITQDRKSVV